MPPDTPRPIEALLAEHPGEWLLYGLAEPFAKEGVLIGVYASRKDACANIGQAFAKYPCVGLRRGRDLTEEEPAMVLSGFGAGDFTAARFN